MSNSEPENTSMPAPDAHAAPAAESWLHLSAPTETVEIRVRDARLNVVARGFGAVNEKLPSGIYQVEYRAGASLRQELVSLLPGEGFEDREVDLPFASPVPLLGTSTSREQYRFHVATLSSLPKPGPQGASGILLFLRAMTHEGGLDFSRAAVRGWELRRTDGSMVLDIAAGAEFSQGEEWLGLSASLPAGGYVLRTPREGASTDQAVWLSPGWLTGLFIPHAKAGPAPARASVQMARLGIGWPEGSPNDEGALEAHRVARATELALAGLREGRAALPPEELRRLLRAKFENPMLGLLSAHSLLLGPKPDAGLLQEVLDNLTNLIPGHPDLAALAQLTAKATGMPAGDEPAATPPMLLASYLGLLARDAEGHDVIPAGSLSEQIAPALLREGSWTTWRTLSPAPMPESRAAPPPREPRVMPRPGPRFRTAPSEETLARWPGHRLEPFAIEPRASPAIGGAPSPPPGFDERGFAGAKGRRHTDVVPLPPPTVAPADPRSPMNRVARYLRELREFAEGGDSPVPVVEPGLSQVCRDTGLPAATVAPILVALRPSAPPGKKTAIPATVRVPPSQPTRSPRIPPRAPPPADGG